MAIYDYDQGLTGRNRSETAAAFEAFQVYLELGHDRSARKVAEVLGTAPDNMSKFCKRNNWVARAAAYDADKIKEDFRAVREARAKHHKKAIEKFRVEQERRAHGMGELADLMMELTTEKLQAMRAAGELPSEQSISNLAKTVASLADMAMNLQATALGVDELVDTLEHELGE